MIEGEKIRSRLNIVEECIVLLGEGFSNGLILGIECHFEFSVLVSRSGSLVVNKLINIK